MDPRIREQLFFVHLNQKQNSREGIERYRAQNCGQEKLDLVSGLTSRMASAQDLPEFDCLIKEHEEIISSIIGLQPVKDELFPDYFGQVKSLGAWGGDFVLATGDSRTIEYFQKKGYSTVLGYSEMVL